NPEGSLQCENCYTPLPASTSCPNCGASVQTDATFCGQCGFNLQAENSPAVPSLDETAVGLSPNLDLEEIPLPDELPISNGSSASELGIMPETSVSSPIQSPWDDQEEDSTKAQIEGLPDGFPEVEGEENMGYIPEIPETEFAEATSDFASEPEASLPAESIDPEIPSESTDFAPLETSQAELEPEPEPEPELAPVESVQPEAVELESEPEIKAVASSISAPAASIAGATQLQIQTATLLHLQSNTSIEIPDHLDIVHFGKPNGQIPPDIDVSGFPDSEVVSRVHADLRIEGDNYYIEDTGSSNGTYINHAPLQKGNRHRLRSGDRIALGKGDLVTFIFQLG
ncbi:MAG: FHA domain-containing protein, partial [Cyanobacteria bacterium J06600_6]